MTRIVLASSSPRRKDILGEMGLNFEIIPADVDESKVQDDSPAELVKKLSLLKAETVFKDNLDAVIIAADTTVFLNNKCYGKPHTIDNAIKMIGELNNKWHTVFTGVTVIKDGEKITFGVESKVKFKDLSLEEIKKYVIKCKPLDKAGAYGIQDEEIVEKYQGSYSNIVGLPKEELKLVLTKIGVLND